MGFNTSERLTTTKLVCTVNKAKRRVHEMKFYLHELA